MLKDFYDDSAPIVRLEDFYGPKKHLVDKCLTLFSHRIYDQLLEQYDCTEIASITSSNGRSGVYSFKYHNETIAFYLSPLGSALASGTVIEINHLIGATKFVMFGSCGSLDGELTKGKYIIPISSYRGEGLSYYFKKASDYIDITNADKVCSIFKELNIPFVSGKNWTTDCMLRETVNLMNKRKQEGCISVEMELAGVQAACDYYHFELYNFLISGDVLNEDDYQITELADATHKFDHLLVALKIMERI